MDINNSSFISVVVPLFNEESNIFELHSRLARSLKKITYSFEIIFVDDGSADSTLNKIKELSYQESHIKYLSLNRNFGHQIAVSAGLDFCIGDCVVIIDGDQQDPPELIPALYAKYQEGFDVVYAKRTQRHGESFFKKFTASIFYRFLKHITTFDIPLDSGDYRLIDRKVVEILKNMPEKNKFLRGQIAWMGFPSTYVEFERDERKYGASNYQFKNMLDLAFDGITSLSQRPLRLVTQSGFFVSFISFLILIYAMWSHFILERTIDGWTSLIISISFLGGVQLFSIGIIGEYISRINRNVLNRPLYLVDECNCQKE